MTDEPNNNQALTAICTPCQLNLAFTYITADGTCGEFTMIKQVRWPGVPAVGQHYTMMHSDYRWDDFEIIKISFYGSGGTGLICDFPPVVLSELLKYCNKIYDRRGDDHPRYVLDRATCIACIKDYLRAGWELAGEWVEWQLPDGTEEGTRFDRNGRIEGEPGYEPDDED